MARLRYEHGLIRPTENADGTYNLVCASPDCGRPISAWGELNGRHVWRHTAPGRFGWPSKWLRQVGDGYLWWDS